MTPAQKAACRHGDFDYFGDDQYIGRSLELYGEYSEAEVELWGKILSPGDVAIDIGANIGALAIPLARLVGKNGFLLAFEPQPENYALLRRNIEQNGLAERVWAFEKALADRAYLAPIQPLSDLGHKNYGAVEIGRGHGAGLVPVNTLDATLADTVSLNELDVGFIKIDVEGHEAEVIKGARETIARYRPILYVECDRQQKAAGLLELLRSMGYQCYLHLPPLFSSHNFRKNMHNVFGKIISINLLCIPQARSRQLAHVVDGLSPVPPGVTA